MSSKYNLHTNEIYLKMLELIPKENKKHFEELMIKMLNESYEKNGIYVDSCMFLSPEDVCGKNVEIISQERGSLNLIGKKGFVSEYDSKTEKYELDFGNGFCGFYKANQIKLV